ncbi:uncharacterized protein LOC108475405 [Gossypium arboreum]|uniref:uncharacterized protein LOC108475405 n=1 Tax=Gossypium arboreum TaxID=29729 RepID=UPI0022F14AF7|nr:uncharacterized protein LOC108475405 [Gossypium arboreum]
MGINSAVLILVLKSPFFYSFSFQNIDGEQHPCSVRAHFITQPLTFISLMANGADDGRILPTEAAILEIRYQSVGMRTGYGSGLEQHGGTGAVRRPRMLRGKHVLLGLQSWFSVLGLSGLVNLGQVLKLGLGLIGLFNGLKFIYLFIYCIFGFLVGSGKFGPLQIINELKNLN